MKISSKMIGLYLTAITVLTACQDELPTKIGRGSVLQINVCSATSEPDDTRAGAQTTWADGESIGLSLVDAGTLGVYELNPYMNVKWSYDAAARTWHVDGASDVRLYERQAAAIAYYPYSEGTSDFTAVPVTAGDTDYMYSGVVDGLDVDHPTADITMKHALTAFEFIVRTNDYGGASNFTRLKVESAGIAVSGNLNAATGVISGWQGAGQFIDVPVTPGVAGEEGVRVQWLAVPTGESDEMSIVVTVDDNEYISTFKVDGGIRAGKNIICSLIISDIQ